MRREPFGGVVEDAPRVEAGPRRHGLALLEGPVLLALRAPPHTLPVPGGEALSEVIGRGVSHVLKAGGELPLLALEDVEAADEVRIDAEPIVPGPVVSRPGSGIAPCRKEVSIGLRLSRDAEGRHAERDGPESVESAFYAGFPILIALQSEQGPEDHGGEADGVLRLDGDLSERGLHDSPPVLKALGAAEALSHALALVLVQRVEE